MDNNNLKLDKDVMRYYQNEILLKFKYINKFLNPFPVELMLYLKYLYCILLQENQRILHLHIQHNDNRRYFAETDKFFVCDINFTINNLEKYIRSIWYIDEYLYMYHNNRLLDYVIPSVPYNCFKHNEQTITSQKINNLDEIIIVIFTL
jgi:hypothetical protein